MVEWDGWMDTDGRLDPRLSGDEARATTTGDQSLYGEIVGALSSLLAQTMAKCFVTRHSQSRSIQCL